MTPWIQDWADALDSGYFRQTADSINLWDHNDGYSALGVLCEILGCVKVDRTSTVNEAIIDKLEKQGVDNCQATFDLLAKDIAKYATLRYYVYQDYQRPHQSLGFIPVDLTGKLGCNACLDLLSGVRSHSIITVEGADHAPCIAALDQHGVPFKTIAEFIRDVWPALAFNTAKQYEPIYKDYGCFKLQRR